MVAPLFIFPKDRGLLKISGTDRVSFLQGLITNDVEKVTETSSLYGALLTDQGKFLHDFFISRVEDALYLECEAARISDLMTRLAKYKLRAKVALEDVSTHYKIVLFMGARALSCLGQSKTEGQAVQGSGGVHYVDPRFKALGARGMYPNQMVPLLTHLWEVKGFTAGSPEAYEEWRLAHGIPDGSRDMIVEKSIPLEAGLDDLNGIAWEKGCYVGQELIARTKHRGLVRKRILSVKIQGQAPAFGETLFLEADDKKAGVMLSAGKERGLALVRLEFSEASALHGQASSVTPIVPPWVTLNPT